MEFQDCIYIFYDFFHISLSLHVRYVKYTLVPLPGAINDSIDTVICTFPSRRSILYNNLEVTHESLSRL
jgi:hypothetical protein